MRRSGLPLLGPAAALVPLCLAGARAAAPGPPPPLGGPYCSQHGACASCVREPAWVHSCQWCAADQRCYYWGNPCGANRTVTNASLCPAPTPARTSFSTGEAYGMLLHSNAVYYDDPIAKGVLPPSFRLNKSMKYSIGMWQDAFAYVGVDDGSGRVVVAFRGTLTWTQLFDELLQHALVNVTWAPQPDALLNEYFVWAVDSLWGNLSGALTDLQRTHPGYEVWFTGHSLGGAMATITAHRAAEMLARPPVVYTFGQPRTSNAAFARLLDHSLPRYFRVTNGGDPVPDVPGCTYSSNGTCMATPTGYHHAGTEIWFPKGDYQNGVMCGYRECTGEPKAEDYACGQASSFGSVYDHCGYFNLIPDGFCNKLGGSPALLPPLAVGGAAETVVV